MQGLGFRVPQPGITSKRLIQEHKRDHLSIRSVRISVKIVV